jgi:hypothetical protein
MKKYFDKFKNSGLLMVLVMLLCSIVGVGGTELMTANAVATAGGGSVDINTTTTVKEAQERSENLLLDTIDKKVTHIRPYDAVLDTIARNIKDKKNSPNQVVRHYATDVLDVTVEVPVGSGHVANGSTQITLNTSNNDIIANDQTLLVRGVRGYKDDGTTEDPDNYLMLYVVGKDNGKPVCKPVNGVKNGATMNTVPSIPEETEILRMGRAGSELQIQSDAYSTLPSDSEQYLQKFMIQIEESTLMKIADKEVDFTLNDQEEEALFEMRQTQNNTFWFGVKRLLKTPNSRSQKQENVYFTQGIWSQAGKEYDFKGETVTSANLVNLMKHSFTGNASGKQKLLICGSDMLEALEQVDYDKTVRIGGKSEAHGLVYNSIVSKFGTLLIVHDQSLDRAGRANTAFVLDPDMLRKWTMGWKTQTFNFKESGEKDAERRMLMEICGLVLKNPKAHSTVYLNKATTV